VRRKGGNREEERRVNGGRKIGSRKGGNSEEGRERRKGGYGEEERWEYGGGKEGIGRRKEWNRE